MMEGLKVQLLLKLEGWICEQIIFFIRNKKYCFEKRSNLKHLAL